MIFSSITLHRKALLFFGILALSSRASAYQCLNKQTGVAIKEGSSDVVVPINRIVNTGETTFFDLSQYFQCKNTNPADWTDFMETKENGLTTTLPDAFKMTAYVNGTGSGIPVPRENIFKLTDGNYHDLPIKIAYQVSDTPGKMVQIKKGDVIATLQLHKYAYHYNIPEPVELYDFTWNIIAGNDAMLTSGSCEISDGNSINVEFGEISNNTFSSSETDNSFRQTVTVPYKCNNPVSMPVNIYLSADQADFSSDIISTTNKNIGIKMLYQGNVVAPGKSIQTSLVKGIGSNQFDFSLVKKPGATIENGPFEGSAILIMAAD